MKISKLQKLAWAFLALTLGTSTVFAQGWKNGNRAFAQNNEKNTCVNYISGLTDEQVTSISELETAHQKQMNVLHDERRATTNLEDKNQIREEMLGNVVTHRTEVKKLLTDDQQKAYDLFHLRGSNSGNKQANYCGGNGSFRGSGNGSCQSLARNNRAGFKGAGYGRGYNRNCSRCN